MTYFTKQVGLLVQDLKTSWYFRIWLLLWIVCAVVSFAAFILFIEAGHRTPEHNDQRVFFTNETSINFPPFQFIDPMDSPFLEFNESSVSCQWNNLFVPFASCIPQGYTSTADCAEPLLTIIRPSSGSVVVASQPDNSASQAIVCWVNVTLNNAARVNAYLGYQRLGNNIAPYWLQGYSYSQILLTPQIQDGVMVWESSMSYLGQVAWPEGDIHLQTSAFFWVEIVINNFQILNYENVPNDLSSKGWSMGAQIGGFAFFTYIIHWLAMILVAVFLDNNSKLLGSREQDGFQSV